MQVIKRNGKRVEFNRLNIKNALESANKSVTPDERLTDAQIEVIIEEVEKKLSKLSYIPNIENIQDMVIYGIMWQGKHVLAKEYIEYRYEKNRGRGYSLLEEQIISLLKGDNDEQKEENANKNPVLIQTQRDYMAGMLSRQLAEKTMPKEVAEAHKKGLIHVHDTDYISARIHNCDLWNLDDCLQNGTVLNGIMIEKPKSLSVAMTVATQMIIGISCSQFGGQTISLAHLSPFIDVSRKKIRRKYEDMNLEEPIDELVEKELTKEIKDSVQTFAYQCTTTMGATSGQAPFLSVFIWLDELPEGQARDDLAMLAEEFFKQRIEGIKAPDGSQIAQTFPKLLYVLDEDNIHEDSPYFWLTELAAKCTAYRMVPDYISAKKMRELKLSKGETMGNGDVYGPMGAVDYDTVIELNTGKTKIGNFIEQLQKENIPFTETDYSVIYDLANTNYKIKSRDKFVKLINAHYNKEWFNWIVISYEYKGELYDIIITDDHPLPVINKGVLQAKDIQKNDYLEATDGSQIKIVSINTLKRKDKSYDVETENHYFNINTNLVSHNCRSFLTPDRSGNGWDNISRAKNYGKIYGVGGPENIIDGHNTGAKYWGRFNAGVTSINLPAVALESKKDEELFWKIFDERLELCHKALQWRHSTLVGTKAKVAPILWQYGALARLDAEDEITPLLYNGYSTISLGYVGLYDCTYYMTGESHTGAGKDFAMKVMKYMNDKCAQWKEMENIDYSLYGTPAESLVYKFATALQHNFDERDVKECFEDGEIKSYIENSYHICEREPIAWNEKLDKESEFQELSPGGAISYIEAPDIKNNIPAVIEVLKHIYNTIMYAEINTKSCDHCTTCGSDNSMQWNPEKGVWYCPSCGEDDQDKLVLIRRCCGYLTSNSFNYGRSNEINDRVEHFGQEQV